MLQDNGNLFQNMTLQDALTVLMVFAARPDPRDCEDTIERIKAIADKNNIFVETEGGLYSRIQLYINSMRTISAETALASAARELPPDIRNLAFKLAVETTMTEEKEGIFKTLERFLDIDSRFARLTVLQAAGEIF